MLSLKEFNQFKIDGSTIIGGEVIKVTRLRTHSGLFFERIHDDGNIDYVNVAGGSESADYVCNTENG